MKNFLFPLLAVFCLFLVSCSKPEGDLKGHYEKMEAIMADGKEDPEKGVERFISYQEKNGPEIARLETEVLMSIAAIEKDGDREERVESIKEELETVQKNLQGTAQEFYKAVRADDNAKAKMESYEERMRDASKVRLGALGLF